MENVIINICGLDISVVVLVELVERDGIKKKHDLECDEVDCKTADARGGTKDGQI
jgi:hypothetical protein